MWGSEGARNVHEPDISDSVEDLRGRYHEAAELVLNQNLNKSR
jgi:hypothetical protein